MKKTLFAALIALTPAAVFADGLEIKDGYVRAGLKTGAAFFEIHNMSDQDDTLVAASAEFADRVELHTHVSDDSGVMRMMEIEGGIAAPQGEMAQLKRGGDHVMFMGLTQTLEQGAMVDVTLVFENAGEIVLSLPVDNERAAMAHDHGGHSDHSDHDGNDHSDHDHGDHSDHDEEQSDY